MKLANIAENQSFVAIFRKYRCHNRGTLINTLASPISNLSAPRPAGLGADLFHHSETWTKFSSREICPIHKLETILREAFTLTVIRPTFSIVSY